MTRNAPRLTAPRVLVALTPVVLTIGFVGVVRSPDASAGEKAAARSVAETAAPVADCVTDDLSGTVLAGDRVREAVLRLTNESAGSCRVRGWAGLTLVTPPGELVRVPTHRVAQDGGGGELVLRPGGSAWSRVRWDACGSGDAGCETGVAFQYVVDADSTGAVADPADGGEITTTALRVGPFQQTRAAAVR